MTDVEKKMITEKFEYYATLHNKYIDWGLEADRNAIWAKLQLLNEISYACGLRVVAKHITDGCKMEVIYYE